MLVSIRTVLMSVLSIFVSAWIFCIPCAWQESFREEKYVTKRENVTGRGRNVPKARWREEEEEEEEEEEPVAVSRLGWSFMASEDERAENSELAARRRGSRKTSRRRSVTHSAEAGQYS